VSRVVHTGDTAAKRRNAHLRSCAEALRHLAERDELADGRFDDEARDMAAFLVFQLRGIAGTIESSAAAWDDRDYWKKAEAFRHEWRWTSTTADRLEALILAGRWAEVPTVLLELLPRVQHVTIAALTRDADWWCGALRALQKGKRA